MERAYPKDLASFTRERWNETGNPAGGSPSSMPAREARPLPSVPLLEELLSACYQASLMREEERPVTFRLVLGEPGVFPSEGGPPSGLHRLEFAEGRPLDEDELRRLSPAADYHRSLIGARTGGEGVPEVWGLVHSGPGWVRAFQGGRGSHAPLPPVLVVHVTGPGRLSIYRGDHLLARLEGGRLSGTTMDVFASRWLPESFAPVRAELTEIHRMARERAGGSWAPLDADLTRLIHQHTVRRIISVMRATGHGGTVVFVPEELTGEFSGENRYVAFKHRFPEGEPRRRFRTLIVGVMNRLAEAHGAGEACQRAVGWEEYAASADEEVAALDEAIFEVAHLIAALSAVDGAVVMTRRFEVLGFGAEISGSLPDVKTVARALDLEAERVLEEPTEGVGTRHRSAYRLCHELKGAVAVVISQDSRARFIKWKDGRLTYWDQA